MLYFVLGLLTEQCICEADEIPLVLLQQTVKPLLLIVPVVFGCYTEVVQLCSRWYANVVADGIATLGLGF